MNSKMHSIGPCLWLSLLVGGGAFWCFDSPAQSTAFTYQGRLNASGSPASGIYDFRFRVAADALGNSFVGSPVLSNVVPVTNGLFTVPLNFGAGIFSGSNYWLQVEVKTNGAGSYTTLAPLQALTPTPYAIFASSASNLSGTLPAAQLSGAVASAQLAGTYSSAVTFSSGSNSFLQNGVGVATTNDVNNSKLGWFNVKDYGANMAIGNDDTAAVQAAVAGLVAAGGGTLYIPKGEVRTTRPIYLPTLTAEGGYSTVHIRGETMTASVLAFTGFTGTNAIIANGHVPEFSDICIKDYGTATAANTGFTVTNLGFASTWNNVMFTGWGVGANIMGVADGRIYGGVFRDNRVGLRLAGFADDWITEIRCDGNMCGLELGGVTYNPTTITGTTSGRHFVSGVHNKYTVVVGRGHANVITPSTENFSNCVIAVGHPVEDFGAAASDHEGIWQFTLKDFYALNTALPSIARPIVKLFAPLDSIIIENATPGGTPIIQSMTNTADNVSVELRGVRPSGSILRLSNGQEVLWPSDSSVLEHAQINGDYLYYNKSSPSWPAPVFRLAADRTSMDRAHVTNRLTVGIDRTDMPRTGVTFHTESADQNVWVNRSGSSIGEIGVWGNSMWIGSYTSMPLDFYTVGTTRWSITAAGNFVPNGAMNIGAVGTPVSAIYGTSFIGGGASLKALNATEITSGTLPDARLSGNVSLLGASIDLSGAEAAGTLAAERFPALTGDATTSAGSLSVTVSKINGIALGSLATGILKNTTSTGVPGIAAAGTDYTSPTSTESFQNKTIDGAAPGNVLKFKQYLYLSHPHLADGTGATLGTTVTALDYKHATFSHSADQAANYVEYRIQVPTDVDPAVALRAKLKFRLNAGDTGTHRYVLSMVAQADSSAATGTVGTAINLDFAGDGSGASGDVESVGYTTLTGWAATLTPDRLWVIRLARDGNASEDTSTQTSTELGLVIEYGVSQ